MEKATKSLFVIAAILLLTGLAFAFFVAPEVVIEKDGKEVSIFSQKIFYYHVPIAETSLLAFIVAAVFGALFLSKKNRKYDFLSHASVELGFLFGALVMWTGDIWTRSEWGTWWEWEPRLTTYLVLMLLYSGYFVLRSAISEESAKARLAAAYSVIAAVTVPLTFFAIRLIPSVHPVVFDSSGAKMEPPMLAAFLISMFGMSVLYVAFLLMRYQIFMIREEIDYLKNEVGG
ncbi:MAG: cytochrome c biogenesis protein CcsA [Firmicutes bacterium]|nr:cytochrome c biogenesis protein CcsA [Bacillota bacterium]